MNKKKSKTKKNKLKITSKKKLINIFLLIFIFTALISGLSYFLMKKEHSTKITKENTILQTEEKTKKVEDEITNFEKEKFEEYTNELDNDIFEKDQEDELNEKILQKIEQIKEEKKSVHPDKNEEVLKPTKEEKKVEDIKKVEKDKLEKVEKKEPYNKESYKSIDDKNIITPKDTYKYDKSYKPKIAILIDDVTTQKQKDTILNMGYKINMAFLPPTSGHASSAKIAQDLPFYMIHFPMQASSAFKGEEPNTLKITDSYETIEKRVQQLRSWYPNAIYTNNHTGSVFTENEEAMDKLFRALKKYNFIFVDSRTSNKSVVKKYAKKYDMPYIVRNTFIDNDLSYQKVQNQLKKAIEIAKTNGYSIAIGHPHTVTLQVLKDSKHLLKDVEPIFINKLPYLK